MGDKADTGKKQDVANERGAMQEALDKFTRRVNLLEEIMQRRFDALEARVAELSDRVGMVQGELHTVGAYHKALEAKVDEIQRLLDFVVEDETT